jgi:hypothetical protein
MSEVTTGSPTSYASGRRCRTTQLCLGDRSHHVEDIPGSLFVDDGKIVCSAALIRGLLLRPDELAGKQAAGEQTPHEQAGLFRIATNCNREAIPVRDRGRRSRNKLAGLESGQVPELGDAEGFGDLPCLPVGAAKTADLLCCTRVSRARSVSSTGGTPSLPWIRHSEVVYKTGPYLPAAAVDARRRSSR